MSISDPNEFSDHCIISCSIECNFNQGNPHPIQNQNSFANGVSFVKKWDQIDIRKFRDALHSGESLQAIKECLDINCHGKSEINELVTKCNSIFLKAANPNFGCKLQRRV